MRILNTVLVGNRKGKRPAARFNLSISSIGWAQIKHIQLCMVTDDRHCEDLSQVGASCSSAAKTH
jgi:hypothetical protein